MGPFFLRKLTWAVMLVLVLGENSCIPGEYNHEGECCPKCVSGKVVKTHCTKTTSTACIPCVDNTYMDHPNGEIKCLRCKTCDKGAGLITTKKCTYTSNTECGCEDGSFCPVANAIECDMCQKHKKCQAGERVKSYGTKLKDTECEKCHEGTFSNDTMTHCAAWTKCVEEKRVKRNGNSTHDTICEDRTKRSHYFIIASFGAIIALFIGCLRHGYFCTKKPKEELKTPLQKIKTPLQEAITSSQVITKPQQETGHAYLDHSYVGDQTDYNLENSIDRGRSADYSRDILPRDPRIDTSQSSRA